MLVKDKSSDIAILRTMGATSGAIMRVFLITGSTIGVAAFCGNLWSIGLIQFSAYSLRHGWGYAPMLAICAVSYLLALGVVQLLIPRIVPVADKGELLGAH